MPGQHNTLSYDVLRVACKLMWWYGVETIPIKFKKMPGAVRTLTFSLCFQQFWPEKTKCQEILHYWQ
jgi:hypothetical protein